MIFEMVVYCGALKEWRILNITTGSLYSMSYGSQEEAEAGIKSGENRANKGEKPEIVKRICIGTLRSLLRDKFANCTKEFYEH
jgi:hypothetical protein